MKQSSRPAVLAERNMMEQEQREEAAELAAQEELYTEFERTGHLNEDDSLFSRWDVEREAAATARTTTIAGEDENGEPFKSLSDYFFAIRDLGELTPEETEVYTRVRDDYRDQELLASIGFSEH